MVHAALPRAAAEAHGSVGHPLAAPAPGAAGCPHVGLHQPGGCLPGQRPLPACANTGHRPGEAAEEGSVDF